MTCHSGAFYIPHDFPGVSISPHRLTILVSLYANFRLITSVVHFILQRRGRDEFIDGL